MLTGRGRHRQQLHRLGDLWRHLWTNESRDAEAGVTNHTGDAETNEIRESHDNIQDSPSLKLELEHAPLALQI